MSWLYYSLRNCGTTATRCRGNCILEVRRNRLTSTSPGEVQRRVLSRDPVRTEPSAPELTDPVIRRMIVATINAAGLVAAGLTLRGGLLGRFSLRFSLAAQSHPPVVLFTMRFPTLGTTV